ncbi:putative lipoprotein aminopeptidase lpqL [Mycobacterium xenopi 3993]|nr:putative lipoprotein aminopeptidase lpqL [Mycobacterium xenopi 3993]
MTNPPGRPGWRTTERAHRVGRYRTHPCRLPEPGRQAALRSAVEHPKRLQPIPGRGRADRRHDHRFVANENRCASPALGGQAGVAFDPNYHSARDTLDHVNRDALAIMGSGVAFAVGTYAQSIDGVNGVPAHDQRHRKQVRP